MVKYRSIIGVAVATSVLLSACMGRQGVIGQQGAVGSQGIIGSQSAGGEAGGLIGQQSVAGRGAEQGIGSERQGLFGQQMAGGQSAGNERRGLFGQQRRGARDSEPVPELNATGSEKILTAKERFAGAAAAHNAVRTKKNLAGLVWSDTLASHAQEWADHLAKVNNCQINHRPTSGAMKREYGENLWWADADVWSDGSRKPQPATIESVVKSWAAESVHYNYDTNSCQPGKECNNYTQIVWQDSTSVGCGYQQCSDKSQIWVCNYNPPGNYVNKKPY